MNGKRHTESNWGILAIPLGMVFLFMYATSGKHPEYLLSSPSLPLIIAGITGLLGGSLIASYLCKRLGASTVDISSCLTFFSLLISCTGLLLFTLRPRVFNGTAGDVLSFIIVYGISVQFCAGIAFAVGTGKFLWLMLSAIAVAEFAYGFLLVIGQAMAHWH
jgi:hypothetical protein